ncbi:MAG: acyltransferase [Deltaproteobacteria bacterium]|nr:acyltransferase [Deltaproteobacteria bacterium]
MLLKIIHRLYSWWLKLWLGRFGRKSTINFPATIDFPKVVHIGNKVWIREHAWLNCDGRFNNSPRLMVGDGSYIGRFVHINAYDSVVLEESVLVSDRVYITDVHHRYHESQTPIMEQGVMKPRPVRLKRGCWIGVGAVIMPGVTIGQNAIVAANAVVTRDLPDNMIARGVPARNYDKKAGDD